MIEPLLEKNSQTLRRCAQGCGAVRFGFRRRHPSGGQTRTRRCSRRSRKSSSKSRTGASSRRSRLHRRCDPDGHHAGRGDRPRAARCHASHARYRDQGRHLHVAHRPQRQHSRTKKGRIFTTVTDNQNKVEVHVLQGEGTMAHENTSLGRFMLTDVSPARKVYRRSKLFSRST